jgi:hypothetical protein
VWQGHKYVLHTGTGREELYDLNADPKERADLASSTDLVPYRAKLAEVHHMEVGPGWRLDFKLRGDAGRHTYVVTLPAPALRAEVIDPEALVSNPANQAWGEVPDRVVADVGALTMSDDHRTLTFVPGPRPEDGLVEVAFAGEVDPSGVKLAIDGAPAVLVTQDGRTQWRTGTSSFAFLPGTVVFPPPSEATRIRELVGHTFGGAGSADQRQMLIDLGYVEPAGKGHSPE